MSRPRIHNYEDLAERYRTTDLSYTAVAREHGVNEATVRRAVKQLGVHRDRVCQCGTRLIGDARQRYCDRCRVLVSQAQKRLYYETNYDRCQQRSEQWYRENRERFQQTNKAWHQANRDKSNAAIRRWKICNGAKLVQYSNSRRARKLNQFIEDVDPTVVYEMHGGMCGICEQFIDGIFHVDHVIPLSKGGLHGYINCQPAHPSCNLKKAAKLEVSK